MAGTTLFVVDMQKGFGAYQECLDNVIREIKLAKRRNDGIVFVELDPGGCGPTVMELVNAAKSGGYSKVAFTTKDYNDGSRQLVEKAKECGMPVSRVRVCGVNRGACVEATIRNLMSRDDVKTVEVGYSATAPGPKTWKESKGDWSYGCYKPLVEGGLVIKP